MRACAARAVRPSARPPRQPRPLAALPPLLPPLLSRPPLSTLNLGAPGRKRTIIPKKSRKGAQRKSSRASKESSKRGSEPARPLRRKDSRTRNLSVTRCPPSPAAKSCSPNCGCACRPALPPTHTRFLAWPPRSRQLIIQSSLVPPLGGQVTAAPRIPCRSHRRHRSTGPPRARRRARWDRPPPPARPHRPEEPPPC